MFSAKYRLKATTLVEITGVALEKQVLNNFWHFKTFYTKLCAEPMEIFYIWTGHYAISRTNVQDGKEVFYSVSIFLEVAISWNVMLASFTPQWISLIFFFIIVDIKTKINSSKFQCAHSQTDQHCKSWIGLVLECNIFMSDDYLIPLGKNWVLLTLGELVLLFHLPMNQDAWWN